MKKVKNKIDIYYLLIIELLLSVYLVSLVIIFDYKIDVGLVIPSFINWHPLVIYIFLFVLVIIEFKYRKPIIKLIYLILEGLILLMTMDNIARLNSFIWLLSIVYCFLVLISLTVTKPKNYREVRNKKDGKLSVGMFSKRHQIHNNLLVFGYILGVVLLVIIWNAIFHQYIFLAGIIFIILLGILFIFLLYKINPLNKCLYVINYKLKYNEFNDYINKIKDNNLHEDSLSYLLSLEANYCVLYNKEKSIEMFDKIKEPKFKPYNEIYNIIKVCYLINKEENEKALELIEELKIKMPKYSKKISNFEILAKIKDKNIMISNIEDIIRIDNKFPFDNFANAYTLMCYYYERDNIENAKRYAKMVVSNGNEFTEAYNLAIKILDMKKATF